MLYLLLFASILLDPCMQLYYVHSPHWSTHHHFHQMLSSPSHPTCWRRVLPHPPRRMEPGRFKLIMLQHQSVDFHFVPLYFVWCLCWVVSFDLVYLPKGNISKLTWPLAKSFLLTFFDFCLILAAECWGHVPHRLLHPFHQALLLGKLAQQLNGGEELDPRWHGWHRRGRSFGDSTWGSTWCCSVVCFLQKMPRKTPGRWGADCPAEACATSLGWIHWVLVVGHEVVAWEATQNRLGIKSWLGKESKRDDFVSMVVLCGVWVSILCCL